VLSFLATGIRTPAHCIEYSHLILWSQQRHDEEFDTDNEGHMQWVFTNALARAQQYGIQVTEWLGQIRWTVDSIKIDMSGAVTRTLNSASDR